MKPAEECAPAPKPPLEVFATTRWSMVLRATAGGTGEEAAWNDLCTRYWRPLFFEARRQGKSPEDAADLVQGFIAHLLEGGQLRRADPARGRFRTFLLSSFRNHLVSEWRRDHALKRGGDQPRLSLEDLAAGEEEYREMARTGSHPDEDFDRSWATSVLQAAFRTLRDDYVERGRGEVFDRLEPHLFSDPDAQSLAAVSEELGRPVGTLKSDLFRLREALRESIREEILQTVADENSLAEELEHFKTLFQRP